MLVLTRRSEEGLVLTVPGLGDSIEITVLGVEGDRVKLGITAPRSVTILRHELCDAVRTQNLAAARTAAAPLAPELVRKLWQPPAQPADGRPGGDAQS